MTETRDNAHEAYARDIDRARLLQHAGPRQIMISTPRAAHRAQRGLRSLRRRRFARLRAQRRSR